jgi:subtilisin family serine protease
MSHRFLALIIAAGASLFLSAEVAADSSFWSARDVTIPNRPGEPKIRIGIWDSGVDLSLFAGHIAMGGDGRPLVRGYDAFKLRADTPMAVLPADMLRRKAELNRTLKGFDDLDTGVESALASDLSKKLSAMSKEQETIFNEDVGRWSGFVHGTAVADIALAGNGQAEAVVARMEWWHGSPPVPCWSKELGDREAASIRDLLNYLVEQGARVVNLSWGRFEKSYLDNLEECAPEMAIEDRRAIAGYTVEQIRQQLRAGMTAAPQVLFVGAAGNSGTSLENANPATRFELPNFIVVGAVDAYGDAAKYTNVGREVAIYANGFRVPARLPGGEPSFPTGTSMATPNVTNAAAKMLAVNPRLSGSDLKRLIKATADRNATGQPILNAAKAVEAARKQL